MIKKMFFLFISLFIFTYAQASETRYNLPTENSPFIGSDNAPVKIIEFIDYQ